MHLFPFVLYNTEPHLPPWNRDEEGADFPPNNVTAGGVSVCCVSCV